MSLFAQLKSVFQIQSDEWPTFLIASCFSLGSVALAIFIRTWSDTLFLTAFQASEISSFYIWSALIFAPTTMGYTWLSQRVAIIRLNTWMLLGFASLCLFGLNPPQNQTQLFVLLLILAIVSPLVNAMCWGMILERLNSRQSKRLIPIIGGGATLGAVLGGALGSYALQEGGTRALMTLICLTLLILAPFPHLIMRGTSVSKVARNDTPEALLKGLKVLGQNKLLRTAAWVTFLMAMVTNLIDYVLKARLQAELSTEQLGLFFAQFHLWVNLGILGVQFFILPPALHLLGVQRSYALYPWLILIGGILCLFPIGLWGIIGLRGVDTLMKFTFQSSTENVLLTPVAFAERTQSKVFLKGVVYPLGGLFAGLFISFALQLATWLNLELLLISLGIILILCLFWILSTQKIKRNYIQQLALNIEFPFVFDFTRPINFENLHSFQHDFDDLLTRVNSLIPSFQHEKKEVLTHPDAEFILVYFNQHQTQFFTSIATLLGQSDGHSSLLSIWSQGSVHQQGDLIEFIDQTLKDVFNLKIGTALEIILYLQNHLESFKKE